MTETTSPKPARTADAWWAWHDQDQLRHESDDGTLEGVYAAVRRAEARCAAWVAGESDDGPEDSENDRAELARCRALLGGAS